MVMIIYETSTKNRDSYVILAQDDEEENIYYVYYKLWGMKERKEYYHYSLANYVFTNIHNRIVENFKNIITNVE